MFLLWFPCRFNIANLNTTNICKNVVNINSVKLCCSLYTDYCFGIFSKTNRSDWLDGLSGGSGTSYVLCSLGHEFESGLSQVLQLDSLHSLGVANVWRLAFRDVVPNGRRLCGAKEGDLASGSDVRLQFFFFFFLFGDGFGTWGWGGGAAAQKEGRGGGRCKIFIKISTTFEQKKLYTWLVCFFFFCFLFFLFVCWFFFVFEAAAT
jgi:hypothetical protein